jgi:hypothetical protein
MIAGGNADVHPVGWSLAVVSAVSRHYDHL